MAILKILNGGYHKNQVICHHILCDLLHSWPSIHQFSCKYSNVCQSYSNFEFSITTSLKIQNGGRYSSQITCLHLLYDSNNKKLSIQKMSCFYDNLNNLATNRSTTESPWKHHCMCINHKNTFYECNQASYEIMTLYKWLDNVNGNLNHDETYKVFTKLIIRSEHKCIGWCNLDIPKYNWWPYVAGFWARDRDKSNYGLMVYSTNPRTPPHTSTQRREGINPIESALKSHSYTYSITAIHIVK